MAGDEAFESDKGIGLGFVLGALAVGAALLSLVSPGTVIAAWGFAASMVFGGLAVVAVHAYA